MEPDSLNNISIYLLRLRFFLIVCVCMCMLCCICVFTCVVFMCVKLIESLFFRPV